MDKASKEALIAELKASIETDQQPENGIENLFGAWEDDRTTEQIIEDIQQSRTPNKPIADFE